VKNPWETKFGSRAVGIGDPLRITCEKNVCNIMVLPEDRSGAVDGGVAVRCRARHYNIILLYYYIRT